jgi:hypothetical protein
MGAERSLGHRQLEHVHEVVAHALEPIVGAHPEVHVQVPCHPAPRACRAATAEAQRRAVVDTGGDVDQVRLLVGAAALTSAVAARRGDLLAGAATCRTRAGRDHLTQDRLAHPPHLA